MQKWLEENIWGCKKFPTPLQISLYKALSTNTVHFGFYFGYILESIKGTNPLFLLLEV